MHRITNRRQEKLKKLIFSFQHLPPEQVELLSLGISHLMVSLIHYKKINKPKFLANCLASKRINQDTMCYYVFFPQQSLFKTCRSAEPLRPKTNGCQTQFMDTSHKANSLTCFLCYSVNFLQSELQTRQSIS